MNDCRFVENYIQTISCLLNYNIMNGIFQNCIIMCTMHFFTNPVTSTIWLEIFDRENFCEKPTFYVNTNFWNNIFMNSCHFHDIILTDYVAIDTGSSSVPDEEFQFTSCIRGFHVYESAWTLAWTPSHHKIFHCSHA